MEEWCVESFQGAVEKRTPRGTTEIRSSVKVGIEVDMDYKFAIAEARVELEPKKDKERG